MQKKLLAIDVGGTFIKYSLVDRNASLSCKGKTPAATNSQEDFLNCIHEIHKKFADEICGVAISMPGIVDSDSGFLVAAGAYTPILGGTNLFELLADLDTPISVENDGNAAVLAEAWNGALKNVRNGAALVIGSGLAGGIIIDGKLYKGAHFTAGEPGLLSARIGDYSRGSTISYYAGMSAFLLHVAQAKGLDPAQFELSGRTTKQGTEGNQIYSGQDVFRWLEEGDPDTIKVYEEWIAALVYVICSMRVILDPEKIVIGGGVSQNPRLIDDLRTEYAKTGARTFMPSALAVTIEPCKFTSDANLIGAAYQWICQHKNGLAEML